MSRKSNSCIVSTLLCNCACSSPLVYVHKITPAALLVVYFSTNLNKPIAFFGGRKLRIIVS